MASPFLPPRLRGGGSGRRARLSLYPGTPAASADSIYKEKKGLLGSGIGPDLNLGIGTALSEVGQGLTGLVGMVGDLAPGGNPAGERWSMAGKGALSSLAGSGEVVLKPFFQLTKALPGDVDLEQGYEEGIGSLLGDKEQYKVQDFWERVGDRGLLPALVQTVGDVSLAGSAVTVPVKGASVAAKMGGAAETSARLAAAHKGLLANPTIRAARAPYRTAGRLARERVLAPAAQRVEGAAGLTRGLPDTPDTPDTPDAGNLAAMDTPDAPVTEAPHAGDRFLARIENSLVGIESGKQYTQQVRMADMERHMAARGPAVRAAVVVARTHLLDAAQDAGTRLTRQEATRLVGDELRARMTGVKAIEDDFLARGVPEDVILKASVTRERFIPAELRTNPELEAALSKAVAAQVAENANVRATLEASRPGDKGLTDLADEDAMAPAPTKEQQRLLAESRRRLERAASAPMTRKIERQRGWQAKRIEAEVDKVARITTSAARVAERIEAAAGDFERSRLLPGDPRTAPDPSPTETGTLAQRGARPPKLPKPPAGTGDFYASGRKGQAALAKMDRLTARHKALTEAAAAAEKRVEELRTVLNEGRLPGELERDSLVHKARKMQAKVDEQLGTPSTTKTPTRWQPLWSTVKAFQKEAEANPEVGALILDGLPQTLHEIQQLALDRGFNPAHVSDFTPTQVKRLVYGSMRLVKPGVKEVESGKRKTRTGALARAGGVDHSMEAFLASTIDAIQEKRANMLVDWVENMTSRKIPKGSVLPDGWALWDPKRHFLLTGEELSPDGVRALTTTTDEMTVVPTAVVKTLDRMTKDYNHWSLTQIKKITSPWRTLVLNLSPGWYVRNIVGNAVLASSEGASLRDWHKAWKSYHTKDEIGHFADMPFVSGDTLAQEAGVMADNSLIPIKGVQEAILEGGLVRGAAKHASRKMLRVNEVVDEFARSAVYHNGLRRNMTKEQAWTRAKTALVDYNALSPFERKAVRSVIPFYAWQKGILKVTLNQAMDHPARVAILAQLGQLQDEYIADRFGVETEDVPQYLKHLVGDHNLRSFNPFADPGDVVSVEGIARSMNPFIELAIRKGLGAPEFYTDEKRLGFFGTPQSDVDVPTELGELVTRSPGGRIWSQGVGQNLLGLSEVDPDVLKSRLLAARRQIRGIPNPETGAGGSTVPAFLPPRLRRAG